MKNRTKLFIVCLVIGYSSLLSLNAFGQSYKVQGDRIEASKNRIFDMVQIY